MVASNPLPKTRLGPSTRKFLYNIGFAGFTISLTGLMPGLEAQTVSTVREAEFRSRWTDYQVDQTKVKARNEPGEELSASDVISKFTQFGPLEFHGGLTTGWEYSNENYVFDTTKEVSNSSLFLAPSLVAIYEKEVGTWSLAARYSVGWLYYLDPNYRGSNGDVTTSQTADVNLLRMNDRVTLRSLTRASAGTGFDIERGQPTDRVAVSETFSAEYQLTEYLRTGVSGNWSYDSYSSTDGAQNSDSTNYTYSGAVFLDNFWTDKTAYRLELSAGGTSQEYGASDSLERNYAQGVFRVNYGPTSKLAFTGSIGLGVRDESQKTSNTQDGLRTVFSLSSTYTPSEKTSVRLYVGIEGAATLPELTLAVNWHPREFTFFELSIYQQTGLSNFSSTDERISKGFLASFRQRFFSRLDTTLSGGYEQNASVIDNAIANEEDPYYFVALALGWQMNRYLTLQTQIRTSSRRNNFTTTESGRQTRGSFSLSLTF